MRNAQDVQGEAERVVLSLRAPVGVVIDEGSLEEVGEQLTAPR